jgi:L-2-hydroxyglutarate oxidase LhgO
MISGEVYASPNAVLGLARDGSRRSDIRVAELLRTLGYPGFAKLAARNLSTGSEEVFISFSRKKFAKDLSESVPGIS